MAKAPKIRRSEATFLQFEADCAFTPLGFWHICNCLVLQVSAGRQTSGEETLQE